MPPKFVSRGVIVGDEVVEKPAEDTVVSPEVSKPTPEAESTSGDVHTPAETPRPSSWATARKELEDDRNRRAEKAAEPTDERSLFAILQDNKAAKQAAFEEQTKFKNQFRALDDDEIEFLDEVYEARRAAEARVRRETEDELSVFRAARVASSLAEATPDQVGAADAEWTGAGAARRRKKEARMAIKGVKRKASDGGDEKRKQDYPAKVRRPASGNLGDQNGNSAEVKVTGLGNDQPALEDRVAPDGKSQAEVLSKASRVQRAALVAYGSDDSDSD